MDNRDKTFAKHFLRLWYFYSHDHKVLTREVPKFEPVLSMNHFIFWLKEKVKLK